MKSKIKNLLSNNLLKKGLSDSSYYLIANVGSRALGFLIIPIIVRMVSVEEFANYDLFLLISTLLQIFIVLGIDSGLVILISESKDDISKLSFLYVFSILISTFLLLILSVILYIVFLFKGSLFTLDISFWYLMMWYMLFSVINYHTFNFLRWCAKAKEASFVNLFAYTIGVVIGLCSIYLYGTIYSFLVGLTVGAFGGALFSIYLAREYIYNFKLLTNSKQLLQELLQLSLPYVPNYIGSNLMQMSDRFIILLLFGKHDLGLYAVIMRLSAIPQFIIGTITSGFMPVMYSNYKSKDGVKLIQSFFNFYFIVIPILVLIAIYTNTIVVDIFAGSKYLDIAYLLPMSLASILFMNGIRAGGLGFSISRKTNYIMYITFISLIINFLLSLVLGYFFNIAGVIVGTLVSGIIRTIIHIKYSEKLYKFDYNIVLLYSISIATLALSLYNLC